MDKKHLQDVITEKDKEIRLLLVKMKEFSEGKDALSLDEKQFVEL